MKIEWTVLLCHPLLVFISVRVTENTRRLKKRKYYKGRQFKHVTQTQHEIRVLHMVTPSL